MESYQRLIDVIAIENLQMRLEHWLLTQFLVWSTLGQVGAILAALGLASLLARPLRARLAAFAARHGFDAPVVRGLAAAAWSLARSSLALLFLLGAYTVASRFGWPSALLTTAITLTAPGL